MRISRDLRKFHLHDSPVDSINYLSEPQHLEFVVQLCDWDGEVEDPEEVFGQSGRLVFKGVDQLRTNLPLENLSWQDNRPEILDLEHKPELDTGELEGVWGLIELPERDDKGRAKLLEFEFLASSFDWAAFPTSD